MPWHRIEKLSEEVSPDGGHRIVRERHWLGPIGIDIDRRETRGAHGSWVMSREDTAAFDEALKEAKRDAHYLPNPDQVKQVRVALGGMSQRRLSEMLGLGQHTFQKYEAGTAVPSVATARLLLLLWHDPSLLEVLQTENWSRLR